MQKGPVNVKSLADRLETEGVEVVGLLADLTTDASPDPDSWDADSLPWLRVVADELDADAPEWLSARLRELTDDDARVREALLKYARLLDISTTVPPVNLREVVANSPRHATVAYGAASDFDIDRETANALRHEYTNYDALLSAIEDRGKELGASPSCIAEAKAEVKARVMEHVDYLLVELD